MGEVIQFTNAHQQLVTDTGQGTRQIGVGATGSGHDGQYRPVAAGVVGPPGSYESSLTAHYAAVRERLRGSRPLSQPAPSPKIKSIPLPLVPPTGPIRSTVPAEKWKVVLSEVADKHKIPVREIIGRSMSRPIVAARFEACWRLRCELEMSLPAIGRRMGGRDHTTVLHAIRTYEAENMAEDDDTDFVDVTHLIGKGRLSGPDRAAQEDAAFRAYQDAFHRNAAAPNLHSAVALVEAWNNFALIMGLELRGQIDWGRAGRAAK